jgi:hypothetical protein
VEIISMDYSKCESETAIKDVIKLLKNSLQKIIENVGF